MTWKLQSLAIIALLSWLGGCGGCGGVTSDEPDASARDARRVVDSGAGDAVPTPDASTRDDGATAADADPESGSDGGAADASPVCSTACAFNASCQVVQGEPRCVCDQGFSGDGATCEDIDECQVGTTACAVDDTCHNIPGGYFCACGPGLVWDGASCVSDGLRRIGAGSEHICRVDAHGEMRCWGMNHLGQLGDGTQTRRSVMTKVSGDHVWRSVSVFRETTCALDTDSRAWCWGYVAGLLSEETTQVSEPQPASPFDDWEQLSLGEFHLCGLRQGGALYCWGLNTHGQLGQEPPQWSTANAPFQVEPGTTWAAVSGGSGYTCAVKRDGTLWCWGNNRGGNLGNGTLVSSWAPVQVGADSDWRTVAAGPFFTSCGIKLDGSLWCWGQNAYGQVGGAERELTTPHALQSAAGHRSVDVGTQSLCGTYFDGTIWCRGSAIGPALAPADPSMLTSMGPVLDVATAEPGAVGLAYANFACAQKQDDTTWCWGQNNDGQLAQGSFANKAEPERVGEESWSRVEPGASFTCGRRQDGTLWCWGTSWVILRLLAAPGQSGVVQSPAQIDPGTDWLSVSVGTDSFCGIKIDHGLWCAGTHFSTDIAQVGSANSWTEIDLGRGQYIDSYWLLAAGIRDDHSLWTFNDYQLPEGRQFGTDTDWDEVAISRDHACGRRGGNLWCWFQDTPGDPPRQVGTESDWTLVRSAPEAVGASGTIVATSYGIRNDGTLWSWPMSSDQPIELTQIGQGIAWQTLEVGMGLICGIATDGSLWCWGDIDLSRAIATRELVVAPDPLRVGSDNDWAQVKIGYRLIVALKTDHSLWSWGYGSGGELGHGDAWRVLPSLAR